MAANLSPARAQPISAPARREIIESYLPLVRRIAYHFSNRGEQLDDLIQVGSLAMIRAVDRCDPQRARQLPAYVSRCVEGELRRHLRDRSSVVRIPRHLQHAEQPRPATLPLADDDDAISGVVEVDELSVARALVSTAARSLDGRERRVVALRYFLDLSQEEIGVDVGVSQVHVSRLLRRAIAKMRARLDPEAEPTAG
jgi:RNA polymerase sigma-B factor